MLYKDLKENLIADYSSFPRRRLAILGDSATQFLAKALKGYGYLEKLDFDLFEADFDQLDRQILDPQSELFKFNPEFIVVYPCSERLWERFVGTRLQERGDFAGQVMAQIQSWWKSIAASSKAKIIQFNFIEINDGVFGHFASKTPSSFLYQLRKLNLELMQLAQTEGHVFVADVGSLSNEVGYLNVHDARLYASARLALVPDFLPRVAKAVVDIVKAVSGSIRKCLVLDLDNTLWGGVIGDDGLENIQIGELGMGHAYDALQKWAKALKERGIILAICSKNQEETAKLPFREHPDMTLRLDDIALFVANWDNKSDNLALIQRSLNIGFDSMVFLDDSPFERNMVREVLPAVTVPELPEDPALYVPYLRSLNLFETASFSEEDLHRTRQYQEETARTDFEKSFTSVDDYLRSLAMIAVVKPFDSFTLPRIAQLTQRSNQFNLRTIRYTEADIERLAKSDSIITLSFQLQDKFGDHGVIGVVILRALSKEEAFIDTWLMSCRVLKRGMEEFIVNQMVGYARRAGFKRLSGEYLPTSKNGMVKDLYSRMGFGAHDGKWELELQQFQDFKTYIREPNYDTKH